MKRLVKAKQITTTTTNSAQILHMYNKSQICMQKLRNQKLEISYDESTKDPEKYIKEVLEPFSHLIKKKELQIIC